MLKFIKFILLRSSPPSSNKLFVANTALNFWITRNSAIADKPRDAFIGQTRSPNMVQFRMLGMVSY